VQDTGGWQGWMGKLKDYPRMGLPCKLGPPWIKTFLLEVASCTS